MRQAKEEKHVRSHQLSLPLLLCVYTIELATAAQPRVPPRPADLPAEPAVREAIGPSDTALGIQVQTRIFEALDVADLRARVDDGVARLQGTVRSETDRLRAADIARDVMGVQRVLNELEVDPTAADDPALESDVATLEGAVAAQLRGDPVLGSRDINVTVDRRSNTLTLTGEVASQAEKERATRITAQAFTVGHVRNRLQVRAN